MPQLRIKTVEGSRAIEHKYTLADLPRGTILIDECGDSLLIGWSSVEEEEVVIRFFKRSVVVSHYHIEDILRMLNEGKLRITPPGTSITISQLSPLT